MNQRLQKILSAAGVASRREAEVMIRAGRVRVSGVVVAKPGSCADPAVNTIEVDGKPLRRFPEKIVIAFHKPGNVMVTRRDPEGRPTVYNFLKKVPVRLNPVGRLDFDSEGLLLLTNDGELQARLTHPRHEVPKSYHVKIAGRLSIGEMRKLREGIDLGDMVTRGCEVRLLKENPHNCWVEMTIREGKNRQIRRMVEALGYKVLRLVRVAVGPIRLGDLPKGGWRELTPDEVEVLRISAGTAS